MHCGKSVRPARVEDVHRVVSTLSDITWQEMRAFFPGEPDRVVLDAIIDDCMSALHRRVLDALCLNDVALALVSLHEREGVHLTSFFGTPRYFRKDLLPLSIHYCTEMRQRLEGDVVAMSRSSHPQVEKWFRLLGFVPVGLQDGSRIFRMGECPHIPGRPPSHGAGHPLNE